MNIDLKIFGYYTEASQTKQVYDPMLDADCPICGKPLSRPMVATNLLVPGINRSYFYRMHRECRPNATDEQEMDIESALVDALCGAKQLN